MDKTNEPNLCATYSLIVVNILIFMLMLADGAGFFDIDGHVHMRWGSNFAPLTLTGDWWRLISNIFIHFGPIHLAMNMYALYSIGIFLEPMLGKVKYLTAYFCAGVFASLASLWWHVPPVNSAGASGAIFGLYGLFFALLTTRLIPEVTRNSLMANTAIFIGYNLFYGIKDGVDNAAHIGGLLSGMVIGYALVLPLLVEKLQVLRKWIQPGIVAVTAAAAFLFLKTHLESQKMRDAVLATLENSRYPDFKKFNEQFQAISEYDQKAVADLANDNLSPKEFSELLKNVSYPAWEKAKDLLLEMEQMDVSENAKKKIALLREYIDLRKVQAKLIDSYNRTQNAAFVPMIEKSAVAINNLQDKIKAM
ncbi:MAG: rhomboid family intramembrane serine protease [Parachlamydia sp.]|nr:rhomboid family intramembrane serine protease [Parachlamydia sp.]